MIFLTVGTWYKGYDRLVKAVDELVGSGVITDNVTAQTGYGSYRPGHLKTINFCSPEEFRKMVSGSKCVISHAGMGTIIETVLLGKPLITVPRRKSLGEVSNDHQLNTAKQLDAEGKILVAYETSELPAKLEQAKTFVPVKSACCEGILQAVKEVIDGAAAKKEGLSSRE